jgi:hypothetical protein
MMIVLKSTHEELRTKYAVLSLQYANLQKEWNDLVKLINAKGGQAFLNGKTAKAKAQFSDEELRKLLMLCHPDKHGGKAVAEEITKKLLAMRSA